MEGLIRIAQGGIHESVTEQHPETEVGAGVEELSRHGALDEGGTGPEVLGWGCSELTFLVSFGLCGLWPERIKF